ncbi:S8 family serine peptidase [Clostridium sp. MSJ-11]|uniref:S8 family serine peptidase n=1 Tax=Clostridium mobile TaxID=2841512 RepID=A0ABS6EM81_9CLOT|nr:S8 family serine peptidase [Clostridium mobile]MBU5486347.1 S8 family serine peptidase [Clostridium mobile]
MFWFKNRLNDDLKKIVKSNSYKNIRVLIHCKTLHEKIEHRIKNLGGKVIRTIPSLNCISANISPKVIDKLLEYPYIKYITFDSHAFLCGESILSANGVVWGEKYRLTGKGICVGIIDSGTYPHSDLLSPNNKIIKFVDLINNYKYPYDDNGHGTAISGIICGSGHLSKGVYRGVAENSYLYSIKTFNNLGKGYVSDILYSVHKLIEESDEFNIKVICLPFEITENDNFILSLFSKLFKLAVEKNIVIVVPSGHNGNDECSMRGIAILENCITVGGLDTTSSAIKPYTNSSAGPSNKIEKPDLSAACVNICSLNSNVNFLSERNGMKIYPQPLESPYTFYTGTSCAAAYVAGICSLLFENNQNLTFNDISSLFKVSCNLLDIPKAIQGRGTVDLIKLLP